MLAQGKKQTGVFRFNAIPGAQVTIKTEFWFHVRMDYEFPV